MADASVSAIGTRKKGKAKSFIEAITARFDQRLAKELATQKRPITYGLICTAVAALSSPAAMLLARNAQNAVNALEHASKAQGPAAESLKESGLHGLAFTCFAVIGLFAFRYWFVRGQTFYLSEASIRLAANLRVRLLHKLLNLPIGYFNERRSGTIQSVLLNDVNVYQNAVGIIRDSLQGPLSATGAFIAILIIQWRIAVIALIMLPFMFYVIDRNKRKMRTAQGVVQKDLADASANTLEVLNGIRVVKAFGAEEKIRETYDGIIEKTFFSQLKAVRVTAALRPMTDFIGASGLSLAFFLCGLLALNRLLTAGDVLAIAYGMDTINQGFRSIGSVTNTFATVQAASERIYSNVLDEVEETEIVEGRRLENPRGRITFENVSFTYPDGTHALRDVSFEIEPDTSLALVGPSGAGKSTIADLLLRFYQPTSGRILLDGVDIKELNVRWLRSLIGAVPQQTFLFAGTVEDNVRLGNPHATDEDLRLAIDQANAREFVEELSERNTAELGERGVRLSGGQMQRVAIARALIKKPTVLLLDEATSALDAKSERTVTDALEEVMRSRTTLFIAHRLTTAARADRILVLSRGEVLECGSHSELLAANGTYAGLFRAFSGGILS